MSLYFDNKLSLPTGPSYEYVFSEWHPQFPILAVATCSSDEGQINLFQEEGDKIAGASLQQRGRITSLAWHPNKKFLAVGWQSGDLITYNVSDQSQVSSLNVAEGSALQLIRFSSEGSRILVTDMTGLCVVFKVDHRGLIQQPPFSKNKLNEAVVDIVLKPVNMDNESSSKRPTRDAAEIESDAIDLFGSKRNLRTKSLLSDSSESCTFFLAGQAGTVYCIRETGIANDCCFLDKQLVQLMYFAERNILISVCDDLTLYQHYVSSDCSIQELVSVKMSKPKMTTPKSIWAGPGVIAIATGENLIRFWDLTTEDNYACSLDSAKGYNVSDQLLTLSFSHITGILSGGTQQGAVAMWKRIHDSSITDSRKKWRLQPITSLQTAVTSLQWSGNKSLLSVSCEDSVYILREQVMAANYRDQVAGIQINQNTILVSNTKALTTGEYKVHLQAKGMALSNQFMALHDGKKVVVYEIHDSNHNITAGSFDTNVTSLQIQGQSAYVMYHDKIDVRTLQGTSKQMLNIPEEEGELCASDVCGTWLVVGTVKGFIRVYDLSRREAKQQFYAKNASTCTKHFGTLHSVKINASGNKIAFIVRKLDGYFDTNLFCWDAETDSVFNFNFLNGKSSSEDDSAPEDKSIQRLKRELMFRNPQFAAWDSTDARVLVVEAGQMPIKPNSGSNKKDIFVVNVNRDHISTPEIVIANFFITSDHGLLLYDVFPLSAIAERLLGIDVPYIYFSKKLEVIGDVDNEGSGHSSHEETISRCVVRRTCRDFGGLENADKTTREAMANFSFHLATGNMDEAFKSIKQIKNESVWENMAKMCVKSQRLDVALVCLGNMQHARGARALRQSVKASAEPEVQLGILAVHLGLFEDAERLYKAADRFDLVNKLLQAQNGWKKATELAEVQDRVHLRNTFYNYAKHLETIGAIQGAIDHYELAGTHRFEVPRMLFENPVLLEQYAKKSKDKQLRKWWAQYLESLGEFDQALNFYNSALDYLSVVRLYCFLDQVDKAYEIANQHDDKAAAYHLARHFENDGDYEKALHFFTKAHAYSNAIRLCKENGMEDQIAQLALMSSEGDMIDAAKFYEIRNGQADKAVMLYHKAGMFGRALDLAFRTEQFSALDLIAADLDSSSDPRVLERCAEFFMKNEQFNKAVQLLGYAKRFDEAIHICSSKNIPIDDTLAEALTPTKEFVPDNITRNKLLEELGDSCMKQGLYHTAAKKYTQAGSTTEAMRALLKSGDKEKITFFANTARNKEIFVMAANFLQSCDWKHEPEISKNIIQFYNKAKAFDHLASFYDACAQVEIDEYRDYEKALEALNEAQRCSVKAKQINDGVIEDQPGSVSSKVEKIKNFLDIRNIYENNPAEAVQRLTTLADSPDINSAVRLGDIYAVLIMHNVKKENYKKANTYCEELKKKMPKIDLHRHIKADVIDLIHSQLNMTPASKKGNDDENGFENGHDDKNEDEIVEKVTKKKNGSKKKQSILDGDINDWLK